MRDGWILDPIGRDVRDYDDDRDDIADDDVDWACWRRQPESYHENGSLLVFFSLLERWEMDS